MADLVTRLSDVVHRHSRGADDARLRPRPQPLGVGGSGARTRRAAGAHLSRHPASRGATSISTACRRRRSACRAQVLLGEFPGDAPRQAPRGRRRRRRRSSSTSSSRLSAGLCRRVAVELQRHRRATAACRTSRCSRLRAAIPAVNPAAVRDAVDCSAPCRTRRARVWQPYAGSRPPQRPPLALLAWLVARDGNRTVGSGMASIELLRRIARAPSAGSTTTSTGVLDRRLAIHARHEHAGLLRRARLVAHRRWPARSSPWSAASLPGAVLVTAMTAAVGQRRSLARRARRAGRRDARRRRLVLSSAWSLIGPYLRGVRVGSGRWRRWRIAAALVRRGRHAGAGAAGAGDLGCADAARRRRRHEPRLCSIALLLKATVTSFSGMGGLPQIRQDFVVTHRVVDRRAVESGGAGRPIDAGPVGASTSSRSAMPRAGVPGAIVGWLALVSPAFLAVPLLALVRRWLHLPRLRCARRWTP